MNRSHVMNVLSYENYCLKVKLQELLEKMANIQTGKPPSPTSLRDEKLENEYKEIINKKDLEIEYLKDMIATLKEEQAPPQDEKIATYEAAIAALQEQHKQLHQNIQTHEATIATYQEQHKLLHETSEEHKNAIATYQEQHKLLLEDAETHKTNLTNLEQQYNLLHTKTYDELNAKNNELEALRNAINEEQENNSRQS